MSSSGSSPRTAPSPRGWPRTRKSCRSEPRPSMRRRAFITLLGSAVAAYPMIAYGQQGVLTKAQSDALAAYEKAAADFKAILAERRAQIDAKQPLPDLPGQGLYLARNKMMSATK